MLTLHDMDTAGKCGVCGRAVRPPRSLWYCTLCGREVCSDCLADRDDGLFCTSCARTMDQFGDEDRLMAALPADHERAGAAWERMQANAEKEGVA